MYVERGKGSLFLSATMGRARELRSSRSPSDTCANPSTVPMLGLIRAKGFPGFLRLSLRRTMGSSSVVLIARCMPPIPFTATV